MSKKTARMILCGIAVVFVIAAILIIALSGRGERDNPATSSESTAPDVTVSDIQTTVPDIIDVPVPTDDRATSEAEPDEPVIEPIDATVLTLPDEPTPEPVTSSREPAGTVAVPITEKTPVTSNNDPVTDPATNPVTDPVTDPVTEPATTTATDPPVTEPTVTYNCGVPGHHCDGPETHAYIVNLEREGCPFCGRHDCPSFYAVDEWGNTCYTPSKCPKYDVHDDPVHYCQECGRKCGDGKNGTCVQFVNACYCPNCGEWVERFTCHTCK